MLRRTLSIVTMTLLGTLLGHAETPSLAITIAIYNDAGVPESPLARAEKHAAYVLARAGVNVLWANCSGADSTSGPGVHKFHRTSFVCRCASCAAKGR